MEDKKIICVTTVPQSLKILLKGQLKFMSSFYKIVGVSSPGSLLNDVSEQEGVHTVPVEITRKITPVKDIIQDITKPKVVFKK